MKICVVGSGYVGLSLAVLISQKYQVSLLDNNEDKINLLKNKTSPISDKLIEDYLKTKNLNLHPTSDLKEAYNAAEFVIIATPTNYDTKKGKFDTSSVESVISDAEKYTPGSYIFIKSTIPLGFTNKMRTQYKTKRISFSPEFLREGSALYDNLYPSRIIVGDDSKDAKIFSNILAINSKIKPEEIQTMYVSSSEAEAIKLFSNTYLAMRVSFFNELDSFSEFHELSTKNVIEGVCSDPRIGNYYNNPSFGYGGYCLPKDTKQLLTNFNEIPNNLIRAIIDSNETRKNFIVESIISKRPATVGIYRLTMKNNSDNFRESSTFDILNKLLEKKVKIYLYEPLIKTELNDIKLENDLQEFILKSDMIIANRFSKDLQFVKNKLYTRDLFNEN